MVAKHFFKGMSFLVFFLVIFVSGCNRDKGGKQLPAGSGMMVPKVNYLEVKSKPIVLTTELPGRVSAFQTAPIVPQVSGVVKKRVFVEGTDVKKGDLLYIIDTSIYESALESAKATLEMAKAKLPALEKQFERYSELIKTKSISQQTYDDTLSALQQLKANIKLYESQVKSTMINLDHCYVKAPISGRIGKSFVTEGATVAAYQPNPMAEIQFFDPVYVDIPRSTYEITKLKKKIESGTIKYNKNLSNKIKLILDDGSLYPYEGELKFNDVTVDPSTGSVILRASFPNKNQTLLPGMYVRAVINEGVKQNAIVVPQESVQRNTKGEPFVYVVGKDGKAEVRMLVIERAIRNKWIVNSGLNVGDKVIVYGVQYVRPGMPVNAEPINEDNGEAGVDGLNDKKSSAKISNIK
ncbi:MAG: efflux RND transporter periplasmic adaptor subunit [Calditerrivibrio sp.]|uniref:efflux RND transporter periplasmic adaptor subunit n=1 Tax=Calditerrivibrio sp. TaxID=2792612 RepID=UPI003D0FD7D1